MLKFEDSNKGPRRMGLDRLVSLLHPADAITEERAGAQIQATRARSSVDK
jgi:hypothetical protein